MISAKCGRCGRHVGLPEESAGQIVKCPVCGQGFLAPDLSEATILPDYEVVPNQEPVSIKVTASKSILLLTILILFVLLSTVGIITVIKARRGIPPTDYTVDVKINEINNQIVKKSNEFASATVAILVVLLISAYVVGVYWCGMWIGIDASRRGMGYMGWFVFYFVYSIASRSFVVFMFGGIAAFLAGLNLAFLFEPLHWLHVLYYFLVRRKGNLTECNRCSNRKLATLRLCPHCSRST